MLSSIILVIGMLYIFVGYHPTTIVDDTDDQQCISSDTDNSPFYCYDDDTPMLPSNFGANDNAIAGIAIAAIAAAVLIIAVLVTMQHGKI